LVPVLCPLSASIPYFSYSIYSTNFFSVCHKSNSLFNNIKPWLAPSFVDSFISMLLSDSKKLKKETENNCCHFFLQKSKNWNRKLNERQTTKERNNQILKRKWEERKQIEKCKKKLWLFLSLLILAFSFFQNANSSQLPPDNSNNLLVSYFLYE